MSKSGVPLFALRLLKWVCPEEMYEEIEGDLLQHFKRDVKMYGVAKARRIYNFKVLSFIHPSILMRHKLGKSTFQTALIPSYLKTSIRSIKTNPVFSLVNITGLAIGLMASVIIALFVFNEYNFDSHLSKKAEIFRIYTKARYIGSPEQDVALTSGWLGPEIAKNFGEIKNYTRYWNLHTKVFLKDEKRVAKRNVIAVDSSFLQLFDFKMAQGSPLTCLNKPSSVVISKEIYGAFFRPGELAINESIKIDDTEYIISGVLESLPANSHLQFDALVPISPLAANDRMFQLSWDGGVLNTYIQIDPSSALSLPTNLTDLFHKLTGHKDGEHNSELLLQSLNDVHLSSTHIDHDSNNVKKFNGQYITVLLFTAVFILIITGINFLNLSTAASLYRTKEIAIRKTVGAKLSQTILQHVFESSLTMVTSFVIALASIFILLPYVNKIVDRDIQFGLIFRHPHYITLFVLSILLIVSASGLYQAFLKRRVKVAGNFAVELRGDSSRGKNLIILQFSLAAILMVCTVVLYQQSSFINQTDPGFSKDQIMLVDMNKEVNEKYAVLKNELFRSSSIMGVTASDQRLGNDLGGWGFKVKTDTGVYQFIPSNINVDLDYLDVYGMKLKDGRSFSSAVKTDAGRAFIVNETMIKELRLKQPVGIPAGHAWYDSDSLGSIIGVVHDFNYNSLHQKINPVALVHHPEWGYSEISIKLKAGRVREGIAEVKKIWDATISSYPFQYSFLDDHFDTLYNSEKQMRSVFLIMACIAICISSMGLFGLVIMTTRGRVKEIGIRKTLGATSFQIAGMLSMYFLQFILISLVIACPVSYYFANEWLQTFAYHTSLDVKPFLVTTFVMIFITLLTICYHTIRIAFGNPVQSLRYE